MAYLTPDVLPEGRDCRALLIPAGSDWLAIVSGALTELVAKYNWQQFGSVTVDEAVAAMQTMIDNYYEGCDVNCNLPTGDPVFRLNPTTWQIEQLQDGEWVAPNGDYTLPPTTARTEPTEDERRCLAAANAVNVLSLLYESLTDSFAEGASTVEAISAFVAVLVGIIGSVFGIVVLPLITILGILFGVIYATVEFIGADLWDEDFTDKLRCFFYECSFADGDVVHFDIDCIVTKIAEATEIQFAWNQIRLLTQVGGIMNLLGAQAIDEAGATTAIETADCDDCEEGWCFRFGDGEQLGDWESLQWAETGVDTPATWTPAVWTSGYNHNGHNVNFIHLRWVFAEPVMINDAAEADSLSGDLGGRTIWANGDGSTFSGVQIWDNTSWLGGDGVLCDSIDVVCWRSIDQGENEFFLSWIQLSGLTGDNPIGATNC